MKPEGRHIHISGVVQGVGFRPFVYGLAAELRLTGWVRNSSAGVDIEVDGPPPALGQFIDALTAQAPPLARIDGVEVRARPANGFSAFAIMPSRAEPAGFQPVAADVSLCADCRRELFDPADRRYHYPFINCTNCGPRFTIIEDIPYDRPLTTMAGFALCPDCAAEYGDPANRRFHAQPVACPICGPRLWLAAPAGEEDEGEAALAAAVDLLAAGRIVAVKGLGGFHLACDAENEAAVAALRRRKGRGDKPFALMLPDLAAVAAQCYVNKGAAALLTSAARPIVILERRPAATIAAAVAPGQATLGVMLPYTPLHALLFQPADPAGWRPRALVMTSGNLSAEPIVADNEVARQKLAGLADAWLLHDRPIAARCDDSVMRPAAGAVIPMRRARGYAPYPVKLPWPAPPLLGVGGELKNTFCLSNGPYAFLSQHIGDLENYETLAAFEQTVVHFEQLFRVRPAAIAHDLHPDYLATQLARERAEREGLPAIGVQHHHAHAAALLAEHGRSGAEPLLAVVFDGAGYGPDGTIWGGEFLVADYAGYERPYHLKPLPLPGGDKAVKEPWRIALAYLRAAGIAWDADLPPVAQAAQTAFGDQTLTILARQLTAGVNVPLTSSMGRLFDAAAALLGVRQTISYEGQAAIELEALADPAATGAYPLILADGQIDPGPLLAALARDWRAGTPPPVLAARFHNSLADMTAAVCRLVRQTHGLTAVGLSGGVWQNAALLARTVPRLERAGFTVYTHEKVPPNDGGLALGQVAVAAWRLRH